MLNGVVTLRKISKFIPSSAKSLRKLRGEASLAAGVVELCGKSHFEELLQQTMSLASYLPPSYIQKRATLMPSFCRSYKVRFEDCDPAGIVFYPNYILMLHRFFEDWCGDGLRYSLGKMHGLHHLGFPTVKLKVLFKKPSRLEEVLEWSLHVRKVGSKSLTLDITVNCGGEPRLAIEKTVVCVDLLGGDVISRAIPSDIRVAAQEFVS